MHSEQGSEANGEQLHAAPELYDYQTVLEALREANIDHDDIAYVCDVVFDWRTTATPWSEVEKTRGIASGLEMVSDDTVRAKALLEQAATVLADEHWRVAREIEQETNAYLEGLPGLLTAHDRYSGVSFVVESVSLSTEHQTGAQLFVSGGETTVPAEYRNLAVYVDRAKLAPAEREALDIYTEALEITPVDTQPLMS